MFVDLDGGLFSARVLIETRRPRRGLFSTRALIDTTCRDYSAADRKLVTLRRWVPLVVRFMHPSHLLQRVAFIPS